MQFSKDTIEKNKTKREPPDILNALTIILILGLIPVVLMCNPRWPHGLIWSFACIAVGFGTGFLFGIPRVLQKKSFSESDPQKNNSDYRQQVNTNLEEISDWLTKIIIGIGIFQLTKIPALLKTLATLFAVTVDQKTEYYGGFGGIIVFFLIFGFLFGYLYTRLHIQGALGRADKSVNSPDDEPKVVGRTADEGSGKITTNTSPHPVPSLDKNKV